MTYHARTIYLFVCDNHLNTVLPWTLAGMADALSGPALTSNHDPNLWKIAFRLPHVLLWTWLNILISTITNQRSSKSIAEDSVNKSWRPIPSGRITAIQAQNLLLAIIPFAYIITAYHGAGSVTAVFLMLNWLYNDLGGSDVHYLVRSALNSLAMITTSIGTSMVAMSTQDTSYGSNPIGCQWLAIKTILVFTTLHVQDLRDQEGDRVRCRSTAPIALGDGFTRLAIAGSTLFWSFVCPLFWKLDIRGYVLTVILGSLLGLVVLRGRNSRADQHAFSLWGLWVMSTFLLPLYTQL